MKDRARYKSVRGLIPPRLFPVLVRYLSGSRGPSERAPMVWRRFQGEIKWRPALGDKATPELSFGTYDVVFLIMVHFPIACEYQALSQLLRIEV